MQRAIEIENKVELEKFTKTGNYALEQSSQVSGVTRDLLTKGYMYIL